MSNNRRRIIVLSSILAFSMILPCGKVRASDDLSSIDINALSSDQYEAIVDKLQDALRDGELSSKEDIQKAIDEAKEEYGVEVDPALEDRAVDIIDKARDMGIDDDKLADLVDDVYDNVLKGKTYNDASEAVDEIEKQLVDSAAKAVSNSIKKTVSDYVKDFAGYIKDTWKELISKWKK